MLKISIYLNHIKIKTLMDTKKFGDYLQELKFDVFTGVPCSYLKNLINYAYSECTYINAPNEGDAVAVASGAWLSGRKPVVLLQNSGLGNLISPLTSLNHIFKIPFLGFVSLRGGVDDEPQHELMGEITKDMLTVTKTPIAVLSKNLEEAKMQIMAARDFMNANKIPFFFIVEKGTFDEFKLSVDSHPKYKKGSVNYYEDNHEKISRNDALEVISKNKGKSVVIATTGKTGRELFEVEDSKQHLYMVGSMGCVSALGLGISKFTKKSVIVIDGDGAALMRLGNLPMVANESPKNLLHVLLDNEEHNSTGGQSTISAVINWPELAANMGYRVLVVNTTDQLKHAIDEWNLKRELTFVYMKINNKTKPNLGRPNVTPKQVAVRFKNYLNS
jgi:phosphonopyruvate decarboxylase